MIIDATKPSKKENAKIHEFPEIEVASPPEIPIESESDPVIEPNIYDKMIAESDAATLKIQPAGESAQY